MQQLVNVPAVRVESNRRMIAVMGLLLACSLLAVWVVFQTASRLGSPAALLAAELEARYGLRVDLAAVTAAGGMVDVRLRIVDAAKAQALLGVKENFPALRDAVSGTLLGVAIEERPQIQFVDGGGLYLLYPNRGNAVKPGSPVQLVFGQVSVEAGMVR